MSHLFDSVTPPVPDPSSKPKPASEMAAEGDREGPVLEDGVDANEVAPEVDAQFAQNGD